MFVEQGHYLPIDGLVLRALYILIRCKLTTNKIQLAFLFHYLYKVFFHKRPIIIDVNRYKKNNSAVPYKFKVLSTYSNRDLNFNYGTADKTFSLLLFPFFSV